MSRQTIPEYFSGKNIFITGGTGFIGKVLIEKILRSCPQVGKICLLVRPKKGRTPEERISDMTKLVLFDRLKQEHPENLKKIAVVYGDVSELNLGLCQEDRQEIINETNIIYHIAASVRFDDPLKNAILMNTRGTREIVNLAKELKNLSVLVHFSTTYCNADKPIIDEILYQPHANWKDSIELAENVDSHTLEIFTEKFIATLPNTYTITKSMAEHVINDLCDGRVPAIIMRPSIVISTAYDPFPGWIDNFNGPVGAMVAAAKGVLKVSYGGSDIVSEYVPCDAVIQATIVATWEKGTEEDKIVKNETNVIHGIADIERCTAKELIEIGAEIIKDVPYNSTIWYPHGILTKCWYNFYIQTIFRQLIMALLLDSLLFVFGKKPLLIRINRKIIIAMHSLSYFTVRNWKMARNKASEMQEKLKPSDIAEFYYKDRMKNLSKMGFFRNAAYGGRRYLMNETDDTIEAAKVHLKRLRILSIIFGSILYGIILWLSYHWVMKYYIPVLKYVEAL